MKLECNVVRDLLPDYIEHILDDKVNDEIKEHLDACQECKEYYKNMTAPLTSIQEVPSNGLIKCKKHMKHVFITAFIIIGLLIVGLVAFIVMNLSEKDKTIDINKYEKYLGANGNHSGTTLIESNIFPKSIPESAMVEDFIYYYYNPWDPCFFAYLVYTCNDEDYKNEMERLQSIDSSSDYEVYGLKGFPDTLCAVNSDDYYGIIYALTQESENRIIYVEITSCNYFNDIDYEKLINSKYLPLGFDMSHDNPTQSEENKYPLVEKTSK